MKDKREIQAPPGGIEILFENRNKEYGAYFIRKEYNKRLIKAFAITCSAFILLLLAPFIIRFFQPDALSNNDFAQVLVIETPIPKGFVTPEYLPPPPPPEKKNTPPLVTIDSVPEEKKEIKKPTQEPPPLADNKLSKDTSQNKPNSGKADGDPNESTILVEENPTWASTDYRDFQDYIQKNIKMPEIDKIMGNYGTVIITALVDKEGNIVKASISKGLTQTENTEALRVIRAMPTLHPAIYHRHPIATYMKVPVTFWPPNQVAGGK